MINAPANYLTENNKQEKSPVYAVLIDGITECFVFTRGKFVNSYSAGAIYKYIDNLEVTAKSVTPEEGKSTIGSLTLHIDDINQIPTQKLVPLTSYLSGAPRKVIVFGGYEDLNFGDMVTTGDAIKVFTGMIHDFKMEKNGLGYIFDIVDLQRATLKYVMTDAGATNIVSLRGNPYNIALWIHLSTGYNGWGIAPTVDGVNALGATSLNLKTLGLAGCYLKTGTVIAIAGNQYTLQAQGTVNALNKAAVTISPGLVAATVGNEAITVVSGSGINYSGTGTNYDILPAAQGLAIAYSVIDIAAFEDARDNWCNITELWFKFKDRIEAFSWLEKEIYKVVNAYPIIKGDGRISIKPILPPVYNGSNPVIDDSRIIGEVAWSKNLAGVINNVMFRYDYDDVNGKYLTDKVYEDASSILKHGYSNQLVIESMGLRGAASVALGYADLGADTAIDERSQRIFQNFAEPPAILEFETQFDKGLIEEGDDIQFSNVMVPNRYGGKGLVGELVAIIEKVPQIMTGRFKWKGLHFNYQGGRYGCIGDDAGPDYATATQADRAITGFMSDDTELMSDGTDAYSIM